MIIQIVPQLPPAINGVGDYALALARQLRQDFGVTTLFVVADPNWTGEVIIEDFPIKKVAKHSAQALNSVLSELASSSTCVLLHYVGYGYAKRGCPVWLVNGLYQWQQRVVKTTLVTMFHEVHATHYPIWSSAFWTEPLQKYLIARILHLSDRTITNKPGYAGVLRKLSPRKKLQIPILPVFSSVGEPNKLLPLIERKPRLVVFGQSGNRLKVYEQSISALKRVCQELGIQEIIDIGSPINLSISEVDDIPIIMLGKQPAQQISNILQDSWVGFFSYPLDFLTRSTIFAAYCSHGVIPVGINSYAWSPEDNGLEEKKHYWLADNQTKQLSVALGEVIANNAYNWYQSHNLTIQAKYFASFFAENF
ncbi:glycosyltransferase family 1 protein [Nostoc sp. CCY0012]|uniref:glycosyltransferase family 1 protein n=1 Tax=Nostoc sp. CCY0012 TaxID=1056123 RepID=UPI0039C5B46D